MGVVTPEMVRLAVNPADLVREWVLGTTYNRPVGSVVTAFGPATLVAYTGSCDHETCYEEHELTIVLTVADRNFLIKGTWSSSSGMEWSEKITEVKAVEKVVQDWEEVPQIDWTVAEMSKFLRGWMSKQTARYGYDWSTLFYAAGGEQEGADPLEIEGFPFPVRGVESWTPGEPDYSGPVFLIFEIDGKTYSIEGRNVSHSGWEFDSFADLKPTAKKTVTMEVWG